MTRKIIQISALSSGGGYLPAVVALADDGSVWGAGFNPETNQFNYWEPLPTLAATNEEALHLREQEESKSIKTNPGFWQRLFKPLSPR